MKHPFLFHHDARPLIQSGICPPAAYRQGYHYALHAATSLLCPQKGVVHRLQGILHGAPRADYNDIFAHHWSQSKLILVFGEVSVTRTLRALVGLVQSWVWVSGGMPRICLIDRVDADVFWEIMALADPLRTGILAFSPPEHSPDTVACLMRCIEYWHDIIPPDDIARRIIVASSCSSTPLDALGQWLGCRVVPYPDPHIPWACFDPVMALAARAAGFNYPSFIQGAGTTLEQFSTRALTVPLEYAALRWALGGGPTLTSGPTSALADLAAWMHHTSFPPKSSSPLAPPLTTLLCEHHPTRERLMPELWQDLPQLRDLASTPLGDLALRAHGLRYENLLRQGHAARTLSVKTLNEPTLGALMMNHLLETEVWAHMPGHSRTPNGQNFEK